jgi:hypothetical protein
VTAVDLATVVAAHGRWLAGESGGQRANLPGANLPGANLPGANLTGANLTGADLSHADLRGANLPGANLSYANLRDANLPGANLTGANLTGANLTGANLSGTVLDPARAPGGVVVGEDGWEAGQEPGTVYGWRTARSMLCGSEVYAAGATYVAAVFSCCPETPCHPGIYLWPTREQAEAWSAAHGCPEIVRVVTRSSDVQAAGQGAARKWRTRSLTVCAEPTP